ncbi:Thioredoxin-like fold [Rhypophila sp. PSN 637]
MSLAPKFRGARQVFGANGVNASSVGSIHTVEIFLDYACPFSAKMYKTLHTRLYPRLHNSSPSPIQFIFRHQIQPWHPSSTLLHEASLAVLRLAPDKFHKFSAELFNHQNEYFDVNVVNESRNATYKRLAKLASKSVGLDETEVYKLLEVSDKPAEDGSLNTGNQVTDDVKIVVKTARLVGVHVSPTVIFNGVVANDISSSWTEVQWEEWLRKNATPV